MRISLTPYQIRKLLPFYDRVESAAVRAAPGMLLAQIRWDERGGKWWMEPGFLQHEDAKLITGKGER